jgi:hypothetical protein
MEAARSSKMLVSHHNTAWHHNTKHLDLNLTNVENSNLINRNEAHDKIMIRMTSGNIYY